MVDTGIVEARNAAKGATTQTSGGKCPNCVKKGLAILPVTYTALPNRMRPGGLAGTIMQMFSPELAGGLAALDNGLSGKEAVGQHWYVMRALPPGYLYILKADKSWEGYEINASGLLRRFPVSMLPPEPGVEMACSRSEHNAYALQVVVLDPERDPTVWIAYSRHRWTNKVLSAYEADEDGRRAKRMLELDVVKAASSEQLGGNSAIPTAMQMPMRLEGYVADYASQAVRAGINQQLMEPLYDRGGSSGSMLLDPAAPSFLKSAVDLISGGTPRKTGIVLLLEDAVGMTAQINYSRNKVASLAADAAGIGDPERARKRTIAEVIEGIRVNAEANPGPWWNRNYGPERYLKHINEAEWREALEQSSDFKAYLAQSKLIAKDYILWKQSASWKAQQRFDFDQDDDKSSLSHELMVTICVAGSGIDENERKEVWEAVLGLEDTDPDNWLSRSLAASNPALLKFMENVPPTAKDQLDSVGLAKSITAEVLIGGDGRMGAIETVNNIRRSVRVQRAANQATSALIETATGVMGRLQESNPQHYARLLRSITKAGLTRDDLVPQVQVVRTTWQRISQWIMEISTGPVQVDRRAAVRLGPVMGGMEYMRTTGNLGREGWLLSDAVTGAALFSEPRSSGQTAEVAFWIINKAQTGVEFDAAALRQFGLIDIPSTQVTDNPALRNHLARMGSHADLVMGSAVLLFQANTIWGTLQEFKKGNNVGENGIKLFAASLSAAAAGLELRVVVQGLVVGTSAREFLPVSIWAARLGLAAGVIDGLYTAWQGREKLVRGDTDSGLWTMGSGVVAIAGSIAAYGFATAALSAVGGGVASATVLGITMGPIGWILLAVAALGAAVYMAIQAFGTDDGELSPVEYWLDNGVFGRRARVSGDYIKKNPFVSGGAVEAFKGLEGEIYKLQRVTLVAVADLTRPSNGNVNLGFYQIALPRYQKGSELSVVLYGFTDDGKRITVSSFEMVDGESSARKFKRNVRLTGGEGRPEIQVDETGAVLITGKMGSGRGALVGFMNTLGGWLDSKMERYVEVIGFGMELTYYPDKLEIPNLSTELKFPTVRKE